MRRFLACVGWVGLVLAGCAEEPTPARPDGPSSVPADAFADARPDARPDAPPAPICGWTQCTDCIDNDGDGLIDSADPECTGPFDNQEESFDVGIPDINETEHCRSDCFFDGNGGAGDDGCFLYYICDPLFRSPYPCTPPAGGCPTTQSKRCLDSCLPLTPNGCDCAGCCTVYGNGRARDVRLVLGCTRDTIADARMCPPCTKDPSCNKPCGPCDFCLGRAPARACPPTTCPGTAARCDPLLRDCPAGFYCLTGCCIPIWP